MSIDDSNDIDLLLASLRADAGDTHGFLQALAVKLDGALPGRVTVTRRGGLFARSHAVQRLQIDLGEQRYTLADAGGGRLQAERVRVVRNVALKTEQLPVEVWLQALATDLAALAATSSADHTALERLLLDR